jgi:hypothetical protein
MVLDMCIVETPTLEETVESKEVKEVKRVKVAEATNCQRWIIGIDSDMAFAISKLAKTGDASEQFKGRVFHCYDQRQPRCACH